MGLQIILFSVFRTFIIGTTTVLMAAKYSASPRGVGQLDHAMFTFFPFPASDPLNFRLPHFKDIFVCLYLFPPALLFRGRNCHRRDDELKCKEPGTFVTVTLMINFKNYFTSESE